MTTALQLYKPKLDSLVEMFLKAYSVNDAVGKALDSMYIRVLAGSSVSEEFHKETKNKIQEFNECQRHCRAVMKLALGEMILRNEQSK